MRITEKHKIIIVASVFVVIVGGLGAVNYFKFKERSDLLAQIDKYLHEEQVSTEKVKQIPELREKRATLINVIDQYTEILPKEEHIEHEKFVETMDAYRRDTKIVIQKAEYMKVKTDEKGSKQETFIRHRYKFKLLGTIPDFIEFVNRIENHTRFFKVDAINIKPLGATDDSAEELGDQQDDTVLAAASEKVKEIELTVSTYTYFKGQEKKT